MIDAGTRDHHGAHELTEAVELGANWTFDYVEKLSAGLVRRYGEERERWVRSAAAVRAQVIDALLAGERIDAERATRRLGYELGRQHLAFAIWSDAPHDRGDIALAISADVGEAREFVRAELGQLLGDDDQSIRLSATLVSISRRT
jgi:DNA-binding PucR family transcriptional regulator